MRATADSVGSFCWADRVHPNGFALGVEQTSPVAGLESLFKVPVNEYFNVLALCSDGECGDSFWGGKVAEDERAKDWGERAPVANDVTCDRHKFVLGEETRSLC